MFTQARALSTVAIFYALARDRSRRILPAEFRRQWPNDAAWGRYWRDDAGHWSLVASRLAPELGFHSTEEPEPTLRGLGAYGVHIRAAAAILAASVSTGCALDVNGLGPVPGADAGAPTVSVVSPIAPVAPAESDAGPEPLIAPPLPPAYAACQAACVGCCDLLGVCHDGTVTAQCGLSGARCIDCTTYGAYCNTIVGRCSVDRLENPGAPDAGFCEGPTGTAYPCEGGK